MEPQVFPNVDLGEGVQLNPPVILGFPPRGAKPGERLLTIGARAFIRPFTTIYAGTTIGADFQTGQSASIREDNILGDKCSVGTNAVLEHGNRIGDGARIHSGCFLELVTLGNHVFLGPNVVFTDDPHPPCPKYEECKKGAILEDYVKVGANATILPGVRIGARSLIGAGSVVTQDIPPGVVAAGNPAREVRKIDDLTCWPGHYSHPYAWELGEGNPSSKG